MAPLLYHPAADVPLGPKSEYTCFRPSMPFEAVGVQLSGTTCSFYEIISHIQSITSTPVTRRIMGLFQSS